MALHNGDVVLVALFAQRRPRTILDETDEFGKSVDKVRFSASNQPSLYDAPKNEFFQLESHVL